ncbi:class B sortase [Bittarella massiliensis (ex Durand et al. 2017)]|uniref:class B sortase n=1 Tax=Bittarella massiliensis (ex Durand et al. 2017) TaxID=1720313 RepID=UPI001AA1A75E|nr:class B sortase [Bittarella massiliensis (ex Durand et al. 2017)]MBO1680548.1 class B sortase [Bittarella massiliensis (ex Durand et al. 2017)]
MDRGEKPVPQPAGGERAALLARVALLALPALGEWGLERLALLGRAAGYGLLALGEWLGERGLALARRAGDALKRAEGRAARGGRAAGPALALCLLTAAAPALVGLLPAGAQAAAVPRLQAMGEALNALPRDPLAYLQPLYAQNSDLVGWIAIEGTGIDFPVVRERAAPYYLTHNFAREEDRFGTPFIKHGVSLEERPDNLIVYGHNMPHSQQMFGPLEGYRDPAFCRAHSTLRFDTLAQAGEYQVVAVLLSRVYRQGEEGFRYYAETDFPDEASFAHFYENIKGNALYDTGVEAGYGDDFLTLSTCVYDWENARLAVVARRISP